MGWRCPAATCTWLRLTEPARRRCTGRWRRSATRLPRARPTRHVPALEAADILEFEQVSVVDVDNGARFETYTIAGERGSREMKVNGAAARLVHRGDTIIVISYATYDSEELSSYVPQVVHVTPGNEILNVDHEVATLLAGTGESSVGAAA